MNETLHKIIRRGDIFYADLGETVGSEQAGIRPVLVLQNDVGNVHSPTLIVAGITSKIKKLYIPTHVLLGYGFGLTEESMVMLEQITTIDKQRIRGYVGTVDSVTMNKIERAMQVSLGLAYERGSCR